ncbi:MAG TPA: HK97-gp10 family putative phage morphogenesis protein [Candidatus Acidoferrales bacterium]|jgi:HK97 gp10 family phage protein|nr:HK97-gp10 family putative phage morphogenesis protein [Candidatus Acidoferrales bacterium]
MPRKYIPHGHRGGSKKGSHANAGARERAHMGWGGNSKASQRARSNQWAEAARQYEAKRAQRKAAGRISVASVARFLEFGTSKMSKRPFMTQAFQAKKQEALDIIIRDIKESLGL